MEDDGQRWSKGRKDHPWAELARLTREARSSRLRGNRASANAKNSSFTAWASAGNFIADRERFDLQTWRYLRPLYDAVPTNPRGVDIVIMKSAQGGASSIPGMRIGRRLDNSAVETFRL